MDLCPQPAKQNKRMKDVPVALQRRLALRTSVPEQLREEGRTRRGRADLGSRPVKLLGIRGDPRDSWDLCGWGLAHKYRAATGTPSHKTWIKIRAGDGSVAKV